MGVHAPSHHECGEVDMDPKGKAALITGGARIGRDVAHALALRGCSVALTYRHSRDIAEATVLAARNAGVQAVAIHADAAEEEQVNAAVKDAARSFGQLDILINMASAYLNTPSLSEADWTNLFDSNAKSAFLFSIRAAPIMQRGSGGRIINFADWLPASGRPRYRSYVPYYASKSAVIGLTEALALEFAPHILVNAIAPGPILAPPGFTFDENSEVIEATPLKRWGGTGEIGKAVLFLIESDFVTGECIRVDGGRHLC